MGFASALYYPNIDITNEQWLKNAILFWDEIITIVPASMDSPYRSENTKYLADEGIVKPFRVNSNDEMVRGIAEDIRHFLTPEIRTKLILTGSDNISINDGYNTRYAERDIDYIYPDKLASRIQFDFEDKFVDGKFRFDSEFAAFYMTLLANKICSQISTPLLTDNPLISSISDSIRFDNDILPQDDFFHRRSRRNGEKSVQSLAKGALTNMIIQNVRVSSQVTIKKVLEFKKRRRDELGLFRENINKLTACFSQEQHDDIQDQIEEIYHNSYLPAYNNFKQSIENDQIKWIAKAMLAVSTFSVASTAFLPHVLALSQPQALLAGLGISITSQYVLYNRDKKEKLKNSPFTYLYAIEKKHRSLPHKSES